MEARKIFKDQRALLALVILIIIGVVSTINPKFIGIKNLITIFQQISVIGILTMAMSVLLIGGGIDLSIGNIMALSGVVMARMIGGGQSVLTATAAGVVVGVPERCDYFEEQSDPADYLVRDEPDFLRAFADDIRRTNPEFQRRVQRDWKNEAFRRLSGDAAVPDLHGPAFVCADE